MDKLHAKRIELVNFPYIVIEDSCHIGVINSSKQDYSKARSRLLCNRVAITKGSLLTTMMFIVESKL
jgi:hypothetical protein